MNDKQRYVQQLLDRYRKLPGTRGRVLQADRRTALALHHRRVGLHVVQQAFLLALARRSLAQDLPPPIRTLGYFLPVIEEILELQPHPDYLLHLERRLRDAGFFSTA